MGLHFLHVTFLSESQGNLYNHSSKHSQLPMMWG